MTECCRCGTEVKLVAGEYALVAPDHKPAHFNAEACEDALRAAFQRKLTAVRAAGVVERNEAVAQEQTAQASAEANQKEKATKDQQAEEAKVKAAAKPEPAKPAAKPALAVPDKKK